MKPVEVEKAVGVVMNHLNELPKRKTNPKKDAYLEYLLLGVAAALSVVWMMS